MIDFEKVPLYKYNSKLLGSTEENPDWIQKGSFEGITRTPSLKTSLEVTAPL